MPYKDKVKQKEAQRRHYQENKAAYHESRKRNRDLRDSWFHEIKKNFVCDCGESDYRCLDFHHLDPTTKKFTIADGVKFGLSEQVILDEIAKCKVVCANCHRREHVEDEFDPACYHRPRVGRNIQWLREFKKTFVCDLCNIADWIVLDFHHRDNVEKRETISKMVTKGCSVKTLLTEIAKCDVRCANCHRKSHNGNKWGCCSRNGAHGHQH